MVTFFLLTLNIFLLAFLCSFPCICFFCVVRLSSSFCVLRLVTQFFQELHLLSKPLHSFTCPFWRCLAGLLRCRMEAKWSLRCTLRGTVWMISKVIGLASSWSVSGSVELLWSGESSSSGVCRGSEGAVASHPEGLSGHSPAPRNPACTCSAVTDLFQSLADNSVNVRFSTLAAFVASLYSWRICLHSDFMGAKVPTSKGCKTCVQLHVGGKRNRRTLFSRAHYFFNYYFFYMKKFFRSMGTKNSRANLNAP